jgi:hypothetical protein
MANNDLADLDYLRSRLDILDCVNRYARGQDRLDSEFTLSAFHPDAVLDYGVFVGNPQEFVDYFFDFHRRHQTSTFHNILNHVCELDGDVAHTETYFFCAINNVVAPHFHMGGGRYIDRFERRNGRWAISARKCVGEWSAVDDTTDAVQGIHEGFAGVGHISRDREDLSYQRPSMVRPERIGKVTRL